MGSQLEQLKKLTTVVADTGDFEQISRFTPKDATTNPSLILKACSIDKYKNLVHSAINYAKEHSNNKIEQTELAMNKLLVNFGVEILKLIPGRVSTEIDANFSFDVEKTVEKALSIIKMYKECEIDKERILIKIASTYEGIKAASILQNKHGIKCNLTLLFSFVQAVECANQKVELISPFVGRILDWYKKNNPNINYNGFEDPGVKSVTQIYNYYKKHGFKTIVMGASFRNIDQIRSLAGCDYLTISPELLQELNSETSNLKQILSSDKAKTECIIDQKIQYTEAQFRFELNKDEMATEKLAEGIRKFAEDGDKLREMISKLLD